MFLRRQGAIILWSKENPENEWLELSCVISLVLRVSVWLRDTLSGIPLPHMCLKLSSFSLADQPANHEIDVGVMAKSLLSSSGYPYL